MNDYYIRTTEDKLDTLINLGIILGIVSKNEETGEIRETNGGLWDYIGPIFRGENPSPLTDPEGKVYVHANLRTPVFIGALAAEKSKTIPEVATALQELGQFFVVDAVGIPRAPNNPVRTVF